MSIAEFYIANGLNPSDPDHMDNFLAGYHNPYGYDYHSDGEGDNKDGPQVLFTGLTIVLNDICRYSTSNAVLYQDEMNILARRYCMDKAYSILPLLELPSLLTEVHLNF